jgi:hypothetical protein
MDNTMDCQLYSNCYADEGTEDPFVVRASQELWSKWMQENHGDTRVFLRIFHPDGESSVIVALGNPVTGDTENRVFMPEWMLASNHLEGSGETVTIEAFESDSLPNATRIVLRPIDSTLFDADFMPVLETAFSRMGVLQQGRQIQLPIPELGITVDLFVEKTEPAAEVYLDGDEIPLEFEQAVDYRPAALPLLAPRPGTPVPPEPAPLFTDLQEPMFAGSEPTGFRAFQGRGNRLGDS